MALVAKPHPSVNDLVSLGREAKRAGNLPRATEFFSEATRLAPRDPSAFGELGACFLGLKDQAQAIEAFTHLIQLEPSNAKAYFGLGLALKLTGSSLQAFHAFRRATEFEVDLLPAYVQVFGQSQHLLNWRETLPVLERGLQQHPESIAMNVAVAATCGKLNLKARAEEIFAKALGLGAIAAPPYAHWLQEVGRFEDARQVLLEAVDLDPSLGEAYHGLAVGKCFELPNGGLLEAVLEVLDQDKSRPESRMFLFYAAAKAYEHRSDFDNAMRFYGLANEAAYAIHNAPLEIDPAIAERSVAKIARRYSPESIDALSSVGSSSETPVFLVGMIRSGTTLLDQILSSHRSISSAGEQPFWVLNAPRMEHKWRNGPIDGADVGKAAAKYLETLVTAAPRAERIVDKMPVNYRHLALIRSAFPNARIIHLRRSPLGTCLSIYTTYLGNATYFAYQQDNIVRNYLEYMALMDLWRSSLPSEGFLEIDYEDLVTSKESTIRRVVSFLGLEWDEACLTHESSSRQVSTPSLYTARQAVHSGSVERWRRFEPWLGKLKALRGVHHPPLSHPEVSQQINP